jgi:hypothetical protein
LVARAVKEADAQRPDDDHALSGVDGMGASFLLQRCSETELALLTSQACTFYSQKKNLLGAAQMAMTVSCLPVSYFAHGDSEALRTITRLAICNRR